MLQRSTLDSFLLTEEMNSLEVSLPRIGLQQDLTPLIDPGFDSWESLWLVHAFGTRTIYGYGMGGSLLKSY